MPPADPDVPAALARHLAAWLGAWPPAPEDRVQVVGWPGRDEPGWDGALHPVLGVGTPDGAVVSVPPSCDAAVAELVAGAAGGLAALADPAAGLAVAAGVPGGRVIHGVFRWSTSPAPLDDAGMWVPATDPSLPAWLRPFGGEALVATEAGRHLAGVGVKRHDPTGAELAVVTDEAARGRGLARRLVAQAARRVVAERGVATYLHAPSNVASARVAEASGFPDRGWEVLAVLPG